jgi:2-keto-3-deoxy-L-rhamnonate aldolase RhmA
LRKAPSNPAEIRPGIFPMIEDSRGVADIEAIAAVKGIAGLHIGPVDLGLGLGLDRNDPKYVDALKKIIAAGHAAKVPVTMHAVRADQVGGWLKMGIDEVVLTADIELIRSAFQTQVAEARKASAV